VISDDLFRDAGMFASRKAWRRAGFDVLDPAKETECMVAAHPTVPGRLFKKYANDVDPKEQRENFATRLSGSHALAELVTSWQLAHVVVPGKALHELPCDFWIDGKPLHVLVVDRMDVVGRDATVERFADISEPVLRELLRVLVRYKGLDSNAKNIQFTRDGKIAFLDLEHWDRTDRDRVKLKSIGEYLSKRGRKLAKKILDELE
jgi:hypothetical protein